ncbi:MAG: sensor domain-containing protein [Propionibacteriaceae bacterium]|jgi:signal transduction histidine kinase|nr:sensor domain-containing protein [Propionibacteriaceae bacterium]
MRRDPLPVRAGKALAFLLFCAVVSLAVFITVMVLFPLGVGLAVLWVGFFLVATAFGLANLHARGLRGLLRWRGVDIPDLPPRPPVRGGLVRRFRQLITSSERWRELGLATGGAILLALLGLVPFALLQYGLLELAAPFLPGVNGLVESGFSGIVIGPGDSGSWVAGPVDAVIGAVSLALFPVVAVLADRAATSLAKVFLSPSRAAVEKRLADVSHAHQATVAAEASSLRHIERDLHDGPQQALIRTGMDLAAAQRRLAEGDVSRAQELLDEAQQRTNDTIQEIRQLARGFAPPILAERGLATALASLAGGSPVPARVHLGVDSSARWSEPVERALYFTAAEAVANAAKHAGAAHVDLTLGVGLAEDGTKRLTLHVRDDGRGGAVDLPGHGLDGLRSRLAGVEGTLTVTSPMGQGTTVTAAVPIH